jgi:hypothetical protein
MVATAAGLPDQSGGDICHNCLHYPWQTSQWAKSGPIVGNLSILWSLKKTVKISSEQPSGFTLVNRIGNQITQQKENRSHCKRHEIASAN